jgi:RNA polymerase sigma factor (sigma-70 family)
MPPTFGGAAAFCGMSEWREVGVAGWREALVALTQERGGALKRYAFLLCGDEAEADDLVQEALVRAFARPGRRDTGEAEAYVRRILLNRFLDSRRRDKGRLRALSLLAFAEPTCDPVTETVDQVDTHAALASLSPRQRACVVLRYYQDLPVAAIAAQLGCGEGTVKRYLSEARQRLAGLLSPGRRADTDDHGEVAR